ncbi:HAMP domain-containing sensor histidine kinase [Nocardioides sp.]|jgi:two-component system sensor histidine kinase MprB|uniref:HAMP domain-containing sensor histidine kinase n=1 Tax=Nocardioides sp. TaxID=35761 RepID=UPI002F3E4151
MDPATRVPPGSSVPDQPRWHYRRSLASRVILMTTLAVCFAVALVSLGAYVTVKMSLENSLDDSLLDRAHETAASAPLEAVQSQQIPTYAAGVADVRLFVLAADGHAITTSKDNTSVPLGQPEIAVANGDSAKSVRTVAEDGRDYRVVAVPFREQGFAVVLVQNMATQERVLKRLGAVMLLFGLAGVIGAAAAGWAVARNGLRPVRRLTRNVERIARTEDLQPLPVEGDDEIARLATAFNDMLVALSASRARQRRLVADAGHELRTPLTSLRTNLDLLLQADADGGLDDSARRELLDDVRGQIEEMSALVGDLVELARDEPLRPVVEQVDLAEVVDRAVSRARRRGTSLSFDVHTEPWWVTGESASLERAVTNLLDNAVKWSPPGGTVRIRLNHGTLTVDDEGPGIDPADRDQVFDRFYRSQESRSMPGSGLGLSIVRQVIERHSGNVRVDETDQGGTRMVLQVPGAPLLVS